MVLSCLGKFLVFSLSVINAINFPTWERITVAGIVCVCVKKYRVCLLSLMLKIYRKKSASLSVWNWLL